MAAWLNPRRFQSARKCYLQLSCQHRHQLHTSNCNAQKMYELRTYSIQPAEFGNFLKLTQEQFHLRTAHSKLLGYWTSELGGLNQVVHIWEYDTFQHRTNVRKALADDPQWISNYISIMMKKLVQQDNVVMFPLPWYPIQSSNQQGGVYELQSISSSASKYSNLETNVKKTVSSQNNDSSKLIGIWKTEHGPLDTMFLLWRFNDLDERHNIKKNSKDSIAELGDYYDALI
ncbi:uncharacterized protein TRIADDRAFT_58894 [Trichoplax adhaerens]|uniref:NIPSNAP domain-containing protein n=1 Tax=Trichoplax adhaerens TaxID=10228 RepID=B3S3Z0_TRIAD|nr:hypothetical protein TRIADDRAFT_58894 [Trichoplax adhaerens]EDV22555.1 hypothetical protein TRIADDRAFT_58894 [Trichoplax adhaerens]|eukprot:XP_002115099.1 hypothetical protein TRIADDRAFT_58894 [Trichoplax adhaerens]